MRTVRDTIFSGDVTGNVVGAAVAPTAYFDDEEYARIMLRFGTWSGTLTFYLRLLVSYDGTNYCRVAGSDYYCSSDLSGVDVLFGLPLRLGRIVSAKAEVYGANSTGSVNVTMVLQRDEG